MKRRNFISAAASSAFLLPLTMHGMNFTAHNKNSALASQLANANLLNTDKILVIINMVGGNDGLNTVIPKDQLSAYNGLRSNVAIPEASILPLAGYVETGLHPAMTSLKNMFDEGKVCIVHSAGYPNPNQSHFRSAEIWMTGTDSNQYAGTGWMGRYTNDRYPGYPNTYPNTTMEDPIALQIGYSSVQTLQGPVQNMAITIANPDNFADLIGEGKTGLPVDVYPNTIGEQVDYIRKQQALAIGYAQEIKVAAQAGTNNNIYNYTENNLADQLKIVARLIHGGLKTKIFHVTQYGYDTHSRQVDATDNRKGEHAKLLGELSEAISLFHKDITLMGLSDNVLGMTYSEFGRRADSNSSKGTDHGVAAPMFLFGNSLKKRMIGTNPNITTGLLPENPQPWETFKDIKMQIDFRRVYGDILRDWFGALPSKTDELLFKNFSTLSLFKDGVESVNTNIDWNKPETWSSGRVPVATDLVTIKPNHKVSLKTNHTIKSLKMEGGEIVFETGKKLTVTN